MIKELNHTIEKGGKLAMIDIQKMREKRNKKPFGVAIVRRS